MQNQSLDIAPNRSGAPKKPPPKKAAAPGISPEVFVDLVVSSGSRCAVIGWTKGEVAVVPSVARKSTNHKIEFVSRPDVEIHFGLSSNECRGFFLHIDAPYSQDWHLVGTSAKPKWSAKLELPAPVASRDATKVLKHYADLGIDTMPYERTAKFGGQHLRFADGQSDEVAGHIEYASVDAEGNAVVIGWATDAPSHSVGFSIGDSLLLMEECYRFERSDIAPVVYAAIGQRSGRAGFMGRIKLPSTEVDDIQVVLAKPSQQSVMALGWSGSLKKASGEQMASELARIWTEPDTLPERVRKVDGSLPPGPRAALDAIPRPSAAFFDGLARGGMSVVLFRRDRTGLVDCVAPILGCTQSLGAILLVNVATDGVPVQRAEVEHVETLLGRQVSIVEAAADLPCTSIAKLFAQAPQGHRILFLDTQGCLDRGARSVLDHKLVQPTVFCTASTLRLASSNFERVTDLQADNIAVAYFGTPEHLMSLDRGWLDVPCWCFDLMLAGLTVHGKIDAELIAAGMRRLDGRMGGDEFLRRLPRLRYQSQAIRGTMK